MTSDDVANTEMCNTCDDIWNVSRCIRYDSTPDGQNDRDLGDDQDKYLKAFADQIKIGEIENKV